jgi:hypothetical protein
MDWEEKLKALRELTDTQLVMRDNGNWYVSAYARETGGDGLLHGSYGEGRSPEEAVNDDWRRLVDQLPINLYIVINAYGKNRRQVRWNGHMWEDIKR